MFTICSHDRIRLSRPKKDVFTNESGYFAMTRGERAGMHLLAKASGGPAKAPIVPRLELGAYEALWLQHGATFKTIAEKFARDREALPSDFVSHGEAEVCANEVLRLLKQKGVHRFGIRVHHAGDYPPKLRDAKYPVELLYYRGAWEISETRSLAIVGTRSPTPDGEARARR